MFEISQKTASISQRVLLNKIDRFFKNSPSTKTLALSQKDYDKLYTLVPADLQQRGIAISYQGRLITCR